MDLNLYVDLDDVLCDTAKHFLHLLKLRTGRTVAFDQLHSFDLSESFGLSRDELSLFMEEAHNDARLLEIAPVEGALQSIDALAREGYVPHIVTGRPTSTYHASVAWLKRHSIPFEALHYVNKYFRLDLSPLKKIAKSREEIVAMKFVAAIEDSSTMADYLLKESETPVLLLDRPWNRSYAVIPQSPNRFQRCAGWNEILSSPLLCSENMRK